MRNREKIISFLKAVIFTEVVTLAVLVFAYAAVTADKETADIDAAVVSGVAPVVGVKIEQPENAEPLPADPEPEQKEEQPEDVEQIPADPEPEPEQPTAPISDVVPLSWELQQAIIDNCAEYGLDVTLVLGIMDVESDFREAADNGTCYGLMQIHRGNQKWVKDNAGVTDIFDSAQNIRAGCWILSAGIDICGEIEPALVWYNAGKVYAESTTYSREVLKEANKWAEKIEEAQA